MSASPPTSKKSLKKRWKDLWFKIDNRMWRIRTTVMCKLRYMLALFRNGFTFRTILIYPQKPESLHAIYIICHTLGIRITTNPKARFDAAIRFEDTTLGKDYPILNDIEKTMPVINIKCVDIGKERVEKIFKEVFDYGMEIDPRAHTGEYVRKSNDNAAHDGKVIQCPAEPEAGFIYQKLINNQIGDQVVDMRLSIFKDTIAAVFYRYKSIHDRFNITTLVTLENVEKVISPEEYAATIRFCKAYGLDCGDLDVLRDKEDGKLYIVDVNNTPYAHRVRKVMTRQEYESFLKSVSASFDNAFM